MQFDPENKVVKLCAEGMSVEGEPEKARALFQQAWDAATNDFEAFTAAHYLARHQDTPEDTLKWNLESLNRAKNVQDDGIEECFPSLYLNVGKSYEDLGNRQQAFDHYRLASDYVSFLPADGFGEMLKRGIDAGLKRTNDFS